MELNYRYSESTVKQEAIESNSGTVYLRKDFAEEDRTIMGFTTHYYTYQEAKLTQEEYEAYSRELVVKNAITNSDSPEKQDAIMKAIADLYEMLYSITSQTK